MSNHNIPISLEMELDDQGCQSNLFMTFDVALENHVANPLDIESENISARAPSSSDTNQELVTFSAPASSHESEASDPRLLATKGALDIEEILKDLQKQAKF